MSFWGIILPIGFQWVVLVILILFLSFLIASIKNNDSEEILAFSIYVLLISSFFIYGRYLDIQYKKDILIMKTNPSEEVQLEILNKHNGLSNTIYNFVNFRPTLNTIFYKISMIKFIDNPSEKVQLFIIDNNIDIYPCLNNSLKSSNLLALPKSKEAEQKSNLKNDINKKTNIRYIETNIVIDELKEISKNIDSNKQDEINNSIKKLTEHNDEIKKNSCILL